MTTPTYIVTPSKYTITEGDLVTFTVNTTNVTNGTVLYWTNNGTTTSGDFPILFGNFTVTNNTGNFSLTATADTVTEGTESIIISIRTSSVSGTVVATSYTVLVKDPIATPPTPSYSSYIGSGGVSYIGSSGGSTGIAFDYSTYYERIASSLETISLTSTAISGIDITLKGIKTSLDTIANNTTIITKLAEGAKDLITSINSDIMGDIDQNVITTSDSTTDILEGYLVVGTGVPDNTFVTGVDSTSVTLSQNLTNEASGQYDFYKSWVGIHTIGPYEWLNYASTYHLYVEQGKLDKDSKPVTSIVADNLENTKNNLSGQKVITTKSSNNYITAGQLVTGNGIADGTYVVTVSTNFDNDILTTVTKITLSENLTDDASGTYEFWSTVSKDDQKTALASLKNYLYKIKSLPTVF
jgi:hypothetical protein